MTLVALVGLAAQILSRLIHFTLFSVYFSGVPPPNWNNRKKSTLNLNLSTEKEYVGPQELERNDDDCTSADSNAIKRIITDDVPACLRIPVEERENALIIKVEEVDSEDSSVTLLESSSSTELGFSIYSDMSSPNLNKALLITPPRLSLVSAQELEFNLLKAASERVSEILLEHRRRLDAGEDSNTIRREARRKRAQELALRNQSGRSF